jgi:hypothetical protein
MTVQPLDVEAPRHSPTLVLAFRRGFAEQLSAVGPGEADRQTMPWDHNRKEIRNEHTADRVA